jgi:mono/diheme cytochrome c family protein
VKRAAIAIAIFLGTAQAAVADGAAVYDAKCAFCHQAGGVGVPGQFPRLAGRVGSIAAKPQGHKFLPRILLDGMSGRVVVDGENILGIMPGFDALTDDDLASVLSYLSGIDHAPVPFTAKEIAGARAAPKLTPAEVTAERARLFAAKIVP